MHSVLYKIPPIHSFHLDSQRVLTSVNIVLKWVDTWHFPVLHHYIFYGLNTTSKEPPSSIILSLWGSSLTPAWLQHGLYQISQIYFFYHSDIILMYTGLHLNSLYTICSAVHAALCNCAHTNRCKDDNEEDLSSQTLYIWRYEYRWGSWPHAAHSSRVKTALLFVSSSLPAV